MVERLSDKQKVSGSIPLRRTFMATNKFFSSYIRYSIYLLFLLLINFFFYSLISIALYKLICNETTYLNLLDSYQIVIKS